MSQVPTSRCQFVPHAYEEHRVALGEIVMNYAVAGSEESPALLLIPSQTESWWGFEKAMAILEKEFQVYAVDLRGQGRSTWTPCRYTIDNMGNDLVRFIASVIQRPVIVSGNSSGGILAGWLSAFAMPKQIRAVHCEDAPFFASEFNPRYGHSIRQAAGPIFDLYARFLGDQWRIGDWVGLLEARRLDPNPIVRMVPMAESVPQNLKEYDPEWGRVFVQGTVAASCPNDALLSQVKTPMLFTHHMRALEPKTGALLGAISDFQAAKVGELVSGAGQLFKYVDAPDAQHSMHHSDAERYVEILTRWARTVDT